MSVDTFNSIGLFQNFDYTLDNPVASNQVHGSSYAAVHGTFPNHATSWHGAFPSLDLSIYVPFARDYGTFLGGNVSAQTLAWWQANHPDWVAYKNDRVTPAYFGTDPYVPLDFTNPAVQDWQMSTYGVPTSTYGPGVFSTLFADNVETDNFQGYAGAFKGAGGSWVQIFSGATVDTAWTDAQISWCANMRARLIAQAHPIKLLANVATGHYALTDPRVVSLVQSVDIVMQESPFTHFGTNNVTGSTWVNLVRYTQACQQIYGKTVVLIHALPADTPANRQYGLASYLMGKYHQCFLFMCPMVDSSTPAYGSEHYYAEYTAAANIGTPLEDMTADQNIYRRTFTSGLALVNPDPAIQYTYTLPAKTWKDLYGTYYSGTVTLPATSALILLDMTPRAFL